MKKSTPAILLILFIGLNSFYWPNRSSVSSLFENRSPNSETQPYKTSQDIVVAQRTSDSTANLTISSSGVQQNIITAIPELDSSTVTADPISIKVNQVTGYLVFNVINSAGDKMTVGLELLSNSGNLVFQTQSGRQIHICKSTGNCNSCAFIFAEAWIVGCNCNSGSNGSSIIPNCQDITTISQ